MDKKYDVICIGQVVQDILVTNIPEDALTCGRDTFLADEILMSAGGDAAIERWTLPGEGTEGTSFDEYHADDQALYEMIIQTFYEETE